VFGHSHFPYRGYAGRTLLFNPGSPTDRRASPKFSYGRLVLNEHGRLTAGHVFL
jgi:predicted phosphodiesterase